MQIRRLRGCAEPTFRKISSAGSLLHMVTNESRSALTDLAGAAQGMKWPRALLRWLRLDGMSVVAAVREILVINRELEQRVLERTRELQLSNKKPSSELEQLRKPRNGWSTSHITIASRVLRIASCFSTV